LYRFVLIGKPFSFPSFLWFVVFVSDLSPANEKSPHFADQRRQRPEEQLDQMTEKLEQGPAAKGGHFPYGVFRAHGFHRLLFMDQTKYPAAQTSRATEMTRNGLIEEEAS
jgi:hypothetical protein